MKAKTARRRMRQNQWKFAKLKIYGGLSSYRGLGKQWKKWTKYALS